MIFGFIVCINKKYCFLVFSNILYFFGYFPILFGVKKNSCRDGSWWPQTVTRCRVISFFQDRLWAVTRPWFSSILYILLQLSWTVSLETMSFLSQHSAKWPIMVLCSEESFQLFEMGSAPWNGHFFKQTGHHVEHLKQRHNVNPHLSTSIILHNGLIWEALGGKTPLQKCFPSYDLPLWRS